MTTKSLVEEIKSWGLYHATYWSSDLNSWRSLCDWDLYFIDRNPECTKEQAHQSLSLELDILLKNLPNRSPPYFNAKALKKTLVSAFHIMFHDRMIGAHYHALQLCSE